MSTESNPISIPAWRRNAKAGIPLAALRREHEPAPVEAARKNSSLPVDLGRILRPEVATRWLLPSVANVTPSYIEAVLRGAIAGSHVQQWELFDLMEDTWPRLVKNLNELKRAVIALDWQCKPWAEEDQPPDDESKRRQKLVSNAVWTMRPAGDSDENGFDEMLYDILDAWAKGISVQEIEWEQRAGSGDLGDILAPRCTFWVHPQNYAWSEEGWLGLNTSKDGRTVERFPEDKFLIARCKARSGNPLATALLRPLAFWWCAANFSAGWFLNFAQIFGVPIRWANYDPNTPGLLNKVADMLENMGSAAWAAFPTGTTLELKDPLKVGTENPQVALMDRADKQCDLLVLGQSGTTEVAGPGGSGGSYAANKVLDDVRGDFIRAAADFAATVINQQLVPAILRLNFGDDSQAPEFCPEEQEVEDEKANAERDQILLQAGVEMPKEWFYKRHQIPLPSPGEEVISRPASQSPFGFGGAQDPTGGNDPTQARHRGCSHGALRAQDATAKVIDATLEDLTGVQAKWLGGVRPFFEELIMLAQSETVTDAQLIRAMDRATAYMPELFGRLDHKALQRAMEAALGAGAVNGAVRGFMQRGGAR